MSLWDRVRAAPIGPHAAAAALYLGSALWVLRAAPGRAVGRSIDLPGTLWFHGFVADCVRHLRLPVHTDAFFAPDGKDIFGDTGANVLDALVATPFLAAFGSPSHMAPFVALLLVGNAAAMHALLRALGLGMPAVVAGSVAFALGPSVLHELDGGRPTQALLWFWPLALRELVLMRTDASWRRPVLAGLFVALQAYTYWFMGHFFAVAIAPALLLWGLRGPEPRAWLIRVGVAGAAALLAVAPAVLPMVAAMHGGEVQTGAGLRLSPGALDPDAWWVLAPWASSLRIPLWWLALLGVGLLAAKNRLLWGVSAGLGVLLVAGAKLAFLQSSVPNPVWAAAELLPGMERLLFAARGWPVLALVGAAAMAEGVDRLGGKRALAACAALVLATHLTHPHALSTTEASAPRYVAAVGQAPGVVLDLPFPCGHLVLPYQALHRQPSFGGMAEHLAAMRPPGVAERIAASPLLQRLIAGARGEGRGAVSLAQAPIRWVVLHLAVYADPMSRVCLTEPQRGASTQARADLEALLGPPTVADARALAWDLQRR